jgi:uncharacterized protein YaaR (DUF327 family)
MRKMIYLAGFVLALGFTACSDDDDDAIDCVALLDAVTETGTAYTTSQTVADCNAYKTALQNFMNGDCSGTATATYQALIDGLTCN